MPDDWREQIARRSSPPLGLPRKGETERGIAPVDTYGFYVTPPPLGFWGRVSRFVTRDYRKPCRAGLSGTGFVLILALRVSCSIYIMGWAAPCGVERLFERGIRIGDSRHPR